MYDPIKKFLLAERRKKISPAQLRNAIAKRALSYREVEARYNAQAQRAQIKINREIREQIEPLRNATVRQDADDPIDAFFEELDRRVNSLIDLLGIGNIVRTAAISTDAVNFRKYDTEFYRTLGINAVPSNSTQPIIDNWINNNTALITRTNADQLSKLKRLFRDNAFTGVRATSLNSEIDSIFKGSRRNVKVISRDQVAKLGGQLDEAKQRDAGVNGYYWRTSRDERVRSSHAALEGQFFTWDRPPSIGHPGQDIQCRCDAEPAVDRALLEGKELKEALAEREKRDVLRRAEAVEKSKKGTTNKR